MKRTLMIAAILAAATCMCFAQDDAILLHGCEDDADIRVHGPEDTTTLRVNREVPAISQGEASLHLYSTSPEDAEGNTYASIVIPISPVDMTDAALVFDAWSYTPETTGALYARGADATGAWAVSWNDWGNPLGEEKTTFTLMPGKDSRLKWDTEYVASDDRSAIDKLRFYIGASDPGTPFSMYIDNIRLVPLAQLKKQAKVLHTGDSDRGVSLSTGSDLDGASLEIVTDPENVSEGTGSVHIAATSPAEFDGGVYLAADFNVAPTDFSRRALAFDAWTTTPDYSTGLYARGYDAEGNTVMSWKNWKGPLTTEPQRFVLYPAGNSSGMEWEPQEIESEDLSSVVKVRFYVGTREKSVPMDLFVDNIIALPEPEASDQAGSLEAGEEVGAMELDSGADDPDAFIEINTDDAYVSEGEGSLHIGRTSPEDAQGNSYVSVNIPISPTVFRGQKLTMDLWTSTPETLHGVYVRGYDSAGGCVLSWYTWESPVGVEKTEVDLVPGMRSSGFDWEATKATADIGSPVTKLVVHAGTHDPGVAVDLFVDDIRSEESKVTSFMSIEEPKQPVPDTPLVTDGQAQAVIVSPPGEEWVALAERISDAVNERAGAALPIEDVADISDDQIQQTNAIVLGNINNNRRLLYPYSHGLVFADGGYPGQGGYDVRTVHDPWGTGKNLISIGASDLAGAEAGVNVFIEMLADDTGTVGPLYAVELSDEAESFWGGKFTQALDEEWMDAWKDRSNNHLVTAGTRGLFSMAQGVGRNYALTRREPYARLFVWMIKRTYENYLSDPDTYGGPWGMDSDFHIYQVIPAWDAVEECPAVTDDERLEVSKILFQWVSEVGVAKGRASGDHVRHNHKTFPALGCLYAGQYFKRHYNAIEGERWIEIADGTFQPQLEATKPYEDCNSYQWLTLYHVFRYCLARPDLSYFENGHARHNADYAILTMNNLGYQVPYGDIGGWAVMGGELRILRAAEWFYRDGRFQWVIDKKMGVRKRGVLGDFAPGVVDAVKPENLIGSHLWPVDARFFSSWDGENWTDLQHAFDKIAFRDGFEPDDKYLLLDGLSAGGHGHMDGNAILQWSENGRIWLADVDYIKSLPKYHNTLLILKDGQSQEPPEFCRLENFTDMATFSASHTVAEDYAGGDWHRYIINLRGRPFIVADTVRAAEAGEYSLRAIWQTLGEVQLNGSNLDIDQDGQHARFAMTPDTSCMVTNDEETGANWGSYPHAQDAVVRVMQGITTRQLEPGDSATLFTALDASGADTSGVEVVRIADNVAALVGDGEPVIVAVPDSAGSIELAGLVTADADLMVIDDGQVYAAGLRDITVQGETFTPPGTVDMQVDLDSGQATVHTPARTAVDTEPFEEVQSFDLPVSSRQVSAMIDGLIQAAPDADETQIAAIDAPEIPKRWQYMDLPEKLLLTGNSTTFGAVDAGMEYTVDPAPLEANVFSGAVGANGPKNMFDGSNEGTSDATMWDDEKQVTIDMSFDQVCDVEQIVLEAWFATSSSKGKKFQLGSLKVLASNDDFQTDTRTIVDFTDEKMHGNWGSPGHAPQRYSFADINEPAKDLRFIATPRPGTAMYIAELQVWGAGEGLAAEATVEGEALNPFTSIATADIDDDGSDETIAGSEAGFVYCLDADGNLRWTFDTKHQVNDVSTVDFDGDGQRSVIAGGREGQLFALDNEGNEMWVFQMPHYKSVGHINTLFAADLTGDGNEVAVAGGDNWRYYAVDANGQEIWHYESVHSSTAGAAADIDGDGKEEVIAGTEYYWWHCVKPDGSKKWGVRTAGGPGAKDVATGDLDGDGTLEVLFGGADTLVQAVGTEGEHLWSFSTGDEVEAVETADINGDGKDEIIAASLSFNVYCLDGEGNMLWRQDLGRPVNEIAVFESETGWNVMAACDDGNAYLLAGDTGNVYGVFATGGSVTLAAPARYNGETQVIVASDDGYLYGIGQP